MDTPVPQRKVWLLGGLQVEGGSGPAVFPAGQLQTLFAYLVLQPNIPHPRERLATLFWPETEPLRTGHNLANLLYRLRQILGPGWLDADGETLTLRTAPDLWVDVHTFEHLGGQDSTEALEEAISLYLGDLLPALYDDWLIPHREGLRETYLTALLKLGHLAEAAHQPETALPHYRQLLTVDPLREDAARGQMRCLALLGRFAEAFETFAALEQTLQTEIGVQPGLETRLLADRLRNEWELAQRAATHPGPVRFVGRVAERARLLALLDRARNGQGGLVVVFGEAGMGKTRLLEELAHAAEWRGWQVAWGRGDEFSLLAPFTPLAQALQMALPASRFGQLAQTVPAISLSITATLIPEPPPLSPPLAPPPDPISAELLDLALARVLTGLQEIGPHLFLLDDAHRSDADVWPVLDQLRHTLETIQVLLVVSLRPNDMQNQPSAWDTLQAWDHAGVPVLHLAGLNYNELRELAATRSLTPHQLERLAAATGGNPLLALHLLDENNLETRLAQDLSLTELALHRIAPLSAQAQFALQIASVIGSSFDYSVWEAVLRWENIMVEQLPALAGEAEQAGAIILDRTGYRFSHDTLRASIYTHIPEPARKHLHKQVLTALGQLAPTRLLDLLYHAQQAGAGSQIARYAIQAGEQALSSFNYETAAGFFTQALNVIPNYETVNRYRALLGRTRAYDILARRDVQREGVEALQALAERLGDARRQAETARYHARYFWQTGDFPAALEAGSRGLERAIHAGDREMQAALLEILGRTARDQGDYAGAKDRFEQALTIYQDLGDEAGQALIFSNLGIVAQRQGNPTLAIEKTLEARQLYRRLGEFYGEARTLGNLGVAYWTSGEYVRARETFEQALVINRQIGDQRAEASYLNNLGGLYGVLGDPENALTHYQLALSLTNSAKEKAVRASLLANCGYASYELGRWEEALAYADEALALNREMGRRRGEGYVQHSRGLILADFGQLAQAIEAFEASIRIREELGERDNLMDTYCSFARFHLAAGQFTQAEQAYQSASRYYDPEQDSTENHRNYHFTSYGIYLERGDSHLAMEHLLQAETYMLHMAALLPEAAQTRFLENIPLNRQIRQALAAHTKQAVVKLVRAEVRLGKTLSHGDYIPVTWTISAPEDGRITLPSTRRRHILRRLLNEAAAQGAAPTDADLAQALAVSRRTILRDMEALREAGVALRTRQRGGE